MPNLALTNTPTPLRPKPGTGAHKTPRYQVFGPVLEALIVLGGVGWAAAPANATPMTFTDNYVLQTQNQSVWGPGGQTTFGYSSGFQGGQWGSFAGQSPTGFGFSAIAGSANARLTPEICLGFLGCIPETTGDTRTGVAVEVSSSGRVGVDLFAVARGGSVDVALPFTTTLQISDTVDGWVNVKTHYSVNSGATITAHAPTFSASVRGVLNLDNTFSATGCIIFEGCSSSSSSLNIDPGYFSLVGVDTRNTTPFSAFGVNLPMVKFGKDYAIRVGNACDSSEPGCSNYGFQNPALAHVTINNIKDFSGGVLNGNVVSASQNSPVLALTADLTGIAQAVLGFPKDVLNPVFDLGIANIKGKLLDVSIGVQLGVNQRFYLEPTPMVTLLFDKPVSYFVPRSNLCTTFYHNSICGPIDTFFVEDVTSVTLPQAILDNGGMGFRFSGDVGTLISRSYSTYNRFEIDTSLSIDPLLTVEAACFELGTLLGGTGLQCALSEAIHTTDLLDASLHASNFELGGFDTATFAMPDSGGGPAVPPFDMPGSQVPEPASLWLTVAALAGLVSVPKWKSRKSRAISV